MSFALSLFRQVLSENADDNVFLSPISVLAAMAMATAGADTYTETELKTALGLEGEYDTFHRILGGQLQALNNESLRLANRLFINDELEICEDYRTFVNGVYGAKVSYLDVSDPEGEARRVNHWVQKNTNQMIDSIIDEEDPETQINGNLLMLIANAIAYKGNWKNQFDPENTWEDIFTRVDGTEVATPMMSQQEMEIPRFCNSTYEGISLALDGDLEMVIITNTTQWYNEETRKMEDLSHTLEDVVNGLTVADINAVIDSYPRTLDVRIPKWEVETNYDLIKTFKALGVKTAFKDADFSRMITDAKTYIGGIIHKAKIKVDERGAEMAAVTVVNMLLECVIQTDQFHANRPFVYFAVDKATRQILFAGRMSDPTAE